MAKREKERDLLLETAEHAIATKWIHEMDDGRSLLAGEGYGINLGYGVEGGKTKDITVLILSF